MADNKFLIYVICHTLMIEVILLNAAGYNVCYRHMYYMEALQPYFLLTREITPEPQLADIVSVHRV